MVAYTLYVEGGGDSKFLRTECRAGFSAFLEKAGLQGVMPRIVACGSRAKALDMFCMATAQGQKALLLVDSESPIQAEHMTGQPEDWQPWQHLRRSDGDGWTQPASSSNMNCHLMVQVMESWFLADKETLESFFGQGFRASALPSQVAIEAISKEAVYKGLENATRTCKTKACYGKGNHSFKILARIEPGKVCEASPWGKRLINVLRDGR